MRYKSSYCNLCQCVAHSNFFFNKCCPLSFIFIQCELAVDMLSKQDASFERQLQCAKLMSLLEPHKKPGHTRMIWYAYVYWCII